MASRLALKWPTRWCMGVPTLPPRILAQRLSARSPSAGSCVLFAIRTFRTHCCRKTFENPGGAMTQTHKTAAIGLGSMGYGIAQSMLRGGHHVWGSDINSDRMAHFVGEGGQSGDIPAETLDSVIVCVLNAAQTEDVLFGEDGIAPKLRKGAAILSCATVPPEF